MPDDKNSSWRVRTYKNPEFINSPEARHIRILSELLAPKSRFEKHEIENTIVFFGSARARPLEAVDKQINALEFKIQKTGLTSELDDELEDAQAERKLAQYYEEATELARLLTEWSNDIIQREKRFIICSGGGPGIMEAANLGAEKAGGPSIGLNISLPFEQDPNPYQTENISFEFHYFFIRKFWFAYLAKALVVFPGGFGTMDELFELLTLLQTEKIEKKLPIVLYGKEFWNDFVDFDALIKWRVIKKEDLNLIRFCDTPLDAFHYIKDKLVNSVL
ncbi:MAG: LOG family protein [Deltaproteobacteria bacterium]|nr:LOG family protein [Deltaproteobacteria bacterium]